MRTLYLRKSLSLNGRSSLSGRRLVDELGRDSDICRVAHVVWEEERAMDVDPRIRDDILAESTMLEFEPDVVMSEGGFFSGGSSWKVAEPLAKRFVNEGGVYIVADVDVNTLRTTRDEYAAVDDFLGARASYCGSEPVLGYDERRFWQGTKQILCQPDDMVISDWLKPVYDGIPEILVGLPVRLTGFSNILASGNRGSTWSDATDGIPGPDNLPFACVAKQGQGFVALIAGNVTGDVWLDGCPHNTRWLVNVARHLCAEAGRDLVRGGKPGDETVFLSHAHEDADTVHEVHDRLARDQLVGAWIDRDGLIAGDALSEGIQEAIAEASYVVVFWSAGAARSEWVRREAGWAIDHGKPLILIRLDEQSVTTELADLLRIEARDLDPGGVARELKTTLDRRAKRREVERVRARAEQAQREQEASRSPTEPLPDGCSLTRNPAQPVGEAPKLSVTGRLPDPEKLACVKSDYRIDLLSYVDGKDLVVGSGRFDMQMVEEARSRGCFEAFSTESVQTGMDGSLDDHVSTRRHLLYGYHDIKVVDRVRGEIAATIECDSSASVMSAAWSPDGTRLVVGSTNYLTVATDTGEVLEHRNMFRPGENSSPKSVVWQPSYYPIFASGTNVCVADPQGRVVRELEGHETSVVCVAVSPCQRYIAASSMEGRILIWSETGETLASLEGFGSTSWCASRCLVFSPDSRWLCQSACTDSDGFIVIDLNEARSVRVPQPKTSRVAFHPQREDVLATVSDDRVTFWRVRT